MFPLVDRGIVPGAGKDGQADGEKAQGKVKKGSAAGAGVQNSFRCLSAENLCLAKRVNRDILAKMRQSALIVTF